MRVELNGLAYHRWISRIMPLPKAIAQDRGRTGSAAATAVVGSGKGSSNDGPDAEGAEEIAAYLHAVDEFALAARRQVEPRLAPGKHAGEDVLAVAQGLPHRVRNAKAFANVQSQQFFRMLDGQILQHDRIE